VYAFFNSGHIDHAIDIFPGGTANGQRWDAQGNQSLLDTGCQPKPADVVTPGQWSGELLDCVKGIVYRTRDVVTTTYTWNAKNKKWVPSATTASETEKLRDATALECPVPPVQPPDEVTYTNWVDEAWACGDTTTEQTRTATTTPFKWDGATWVPDPASATSTTQQQTRNLTQAEITQCPVQDADATATANNDATCDRLGTVTFNVTNARWQDHNDTHDGSRVAVAENGHLFGNGSTQLIVNYTPVPKKTGPECATVLASVAVATPVLTPPTCTAAGVLTYSDHLGYTWRRTDDHGNVVLTAIAKPGFTLTGQTSWTYTAAQLAKLSGDKACPPAVIPPKVEGVKHTAPPKVPVVSPVVEGVKHEAAKNLPRTGSESGLYGAAGLLLLMVGSGLVLATRQRSNEGRAH
jgi:LPXTG-motif cell wall-anchored protein